MKLHVYSVFDSKAKAYLPPFFLHTHGLAERAFADCVNSDSHQFGKNPGDYTLFHLGSWEDDCALFDSFAPVSMGNGLEFVREFDNQAKPVPVEPEHITHKPNGA